MKVRRRTVAFLSVRHLIIEDYRLLPVHCIGFFFFFFFSLTSTRLTCDKQRSDILDVCRSCYELVYKNACRVLGICIYTKTKMQRIIRGSFFALCLIGRWYTNVLLSISSLRFWNEFFRRSLNVDTCIVADMVSVKNPEKNNKHRRY